MASAKPTLNPLTDTPENKTQITKPFMLAFMRCEKATDDDRKWFVDTCKKYPKEKTNPLNGQTYQDIDVPAVRKEFVNRFYPQLNTKKKSKSFLDEVMDLI